MYKRQDLLDKFDDMAEKTGISASKLSELRFAGEVAGTSFDSLETGIRKLAVAMSSSRDETSQQAEWFRQLGVQTKDANGKLRSSEAVLLDVAEAFSTYENGAGKTAAAIALFGKQGEAMIPFLNKGREGIEDLRKEAQQLGAVFGDDVAAQAAKFNDQLAKLKLVGDGFRVAMLSKIVDPLNDFLRSVIEAQKQFGGLLKMLPAAIEFGGAPTNQDQIDFKLRELAERRAQTAAYPTRLGYSKQDRDDDLKDIDAQIERTKRLGAVLFDASKMAGGGRGFIIPELANPQGKRTAPNLKEKPDGNAPKDQESAYAGLNLSLIHISEPTRPCGTSRMPSSA